MLGNPSSQHQYQQGAGGADPVCVSRDCSNDQDDKDSGGPCTSSAPKRSPSHGVRSTSRTNDLRGDRAECRLNASRNRYGAVIQQAEDCFHSVNRPTAPHCALAGVLLSRPLQVLGTSTFPPRAPAKVSTTALEDRLKRPSRLPVQRAPAASSVKEKSPLRERCKPPPKSSTSPLEQTTKRPIAIHQNNAFPLAIRRETRPAISVDVALLSHAVLILPIALGPAARERISLRMATRAPSSLPSPRAHHVAPQRPVRLASSLLTACKQQ